MTSLLNNMPEISANARKECDLWEYNFKEPTNIPLTEVIINIIIFLFLNRMKLKRKLKKKQKLKLNG